MHCSLAFTGADDVLDAVGAAEVPVHDGDASEHPSDSDSSSSSSDEDALGPEEGVLGGPGDVADVAMS